MNSLSALEYRAIDDAFGASGVAGAELLINMRTRIPEPAPVPVGRSTDRTALPGFGPVFTAGYVSECPGCCADVEPGQPARMFDGNAWHEDCAKADESGWAYGPDGWEP